VKPQKTSFNKNCIEKWFFLLLPTGTKKTSCRALPHAPQDPNTIIVLKKLQRHENMALLSPDYQVVKEYM